MRVVLNAASLARFHSGISVYTLGLLRGLESLQDAPDIDLFAHGRWVESWRDFSIEGGGRVSPVVKMARLLPGARWGFRRYQQVRFRRRAMARQPSLYHEPNFVPFDIPGPLVLTVHDLAWVRHPQYLPAERLRFMRREMPDALARASAVITVSTRVSQELQEDFPQVRGKVYAVHNGKDPDFARMEGADLEAALAPFSLRSQSYFLSVGTIEPRKNVIAVLEAYRKLPDRTRQDYPLVVAGPQGWLDRTIRRTMAPMIESGELRFLGYVDRPSLVALYSGARAFAFPSWYEGFGLPAVEAQACGAPVITSDRGSLPEVAGEAAVYVAPDDTEALRDSLQRLAEDDALVTRMRELGLENSERFCWNRCASHTCDVYAEVAAAGMLR